MAAINFELKEYQRLALGRFSDYLRSASNDGADIAFYRH